MEADEGAYDDSAQEGFLEGVFPGAVVAPKKPLPVGASEVKSKSPTVGVWKQINGNRRTAAG